MPPFVLRRTGSVAAAGLYMCCMSSLDDVGFVRAASTEPPALQSLAAEWQQYHRGLGHDSDPVSWAAPKHGLALPTANSQLGSVIADENVLAIRDLTMPPFTQGPWSSVQRDASRLGRVLLNGVPVYTQRSKWSPLGFQREAKTADGRTISTEVRLPLHENGVLLQMNVSAGDEADLGLDLLPEIRSYPASEMNCSEQQWRYPSNMQRNCWNWYAPRSFKNESRDYVARGSESSSSYVWTSADTVSGAVTVVAVRFTPALEEIDARDNSSILVRVADGQAIQVSIAVSFGEQREEANVSSRATHWVADIAGAFSAAARERQVNLANTSTSAEVSLRCWFCACG